MSNQLKIPVKYAFGRMAITDGCVRERVSGYNWEYRASGGVVAQVYLGKDSSGIRKGGIVRLSHLVYGAVPAGHVIDHINRNPLDNRRCNLRPATLSENARNCSPWSSSTKKSKSAYKGVSFSKGSWIARICRDRRLFALGSYQTEIEAAAAYDYAALKLHGEFAYYNLGFPTRQTWPEIDWLITKPVQSVAESCLTRSKRRGCSTSFRGVTRKGAKFVAQIRHRGKLYFLGNFFSPQEAHDAYCARFKKIHGFDPVNAVIR